MREKLKKWWCEKYHQIIEREYWWPIAVIRKGDWMWKCNRCGRTFPD